MVLSIHDYTIDRAKIRANIARRKSTREDPEAPVHSEIGCIARANPYDVTLQEHMNAHVGWYIWELMATGNWGTVHGVFYPDGTVRDPAILSPRCSASSATVETVCGRCSARENHLTEA